MTKYSKEEVDYSRGHIDSHCGWCFEDDTGYCKHFIRIKPPSEKGKCRLVEGDINALFWCKKWEKKE